MEGGRPPPAALNYASILSKHRLPPLLKPIDLPLKPATEHCGKLALIFSEEESNLLEAPLKRALIGNLSRGKPTIEDIRTDFLTAGFESGFHIGLIDPRKVLIRFEQDIDYNRCFLKGVWNFRSYAVRITKWTPNFNPKEESSIVPVWVSLPQLPFQLYDEWSLMSIGNMFGRALKVDFASAHISRPSVARVCTEIDLLKPLPESIYLETRGRGFLQILEFERMPQYCTCCYKVGHHQSDCRKGDPPPLKQQWKRKSLDNPDPSPLLTDKGKAKLSANVQPSACLAPARPLAASSSAQTTASYGQPVHIEPTIEAQHQQPSAQPPQPQHNATVAGAAHEVLDSDSNETDTEMAFADPEPVAKETQCPTDGHSMNSVHGMPCPQPIRHNVTAAWEEPAQATANQPTTDDSQASHLSATALTYATISTQGARHKVPTSPTQEIASEPNQPARRNASPVGASSTPPTGHTKHRAESASCADTHAAASSI